MSSLLLYDCNLVTNFKCSLCMGVNCVCVSLCGLLSPNPEIGCQILFCPFKILCHFVNGPGTIIFKFPITLTPKEKQIKMKGQFWDHC